MRPCHREDIPDAPLIVYVLFSGEKLIGFKTITRTGTDEIPACFHTSF